MHTNSKIENLIELSGNDCERKRNAFLFFSRALLLSIISLVIKSCTQSTGQSLDSDSSSSSSSSSYSSLGNLRGAGEPITFGGKQYIAKDQRSDGDCGPEAIRQLLLIDEPNTSIKDAETMRSEIVTTVANTIRLNNILVDSKNGPLADVDTVKDLFVAIFHNNKDYCGSLLQYAIYTGKKNLDSFNAQLLSAPDLANFVKKLSAKEILDIFENLSLVNTDPINEHLELKQPLNTNQQVSADLIDQYIKIVKDSKVWLIDEELKLSAKTFGLHYLNHLNIFLENQESTMFVFIRGNLDSIHNPKYKQLVKCFQKKYESLGGKVVGSDVDQARIATCKQIFNEITKVSHEHHQLLENFTNEINEEKDKFVYLYNNGLNGGGSHWTACTQESDIHYNNPLLCLLFESFIIGDVLE